MSNLNETKLLFCLNKLKFLLVLFQKFLISYKLFLKINKPVNCLRFFLFLIKECIKIDPFMPSLEILTCFNWWYSVAFMYSVPMNFSHFGFSYWIDQLVTVTINFRHLLPYLYDKHHKFALIWRAESRNSFASHLIC